MTLKLQTVMTVDIQNSISKLYKKMNKKQGMASQSWCSLFKIHIYIV